jgi:hypothetical protein
VVVVSSAVYSSEAVIAHSNWSHAALSPNILKMEARLAKLEERLLDVEKFTNMPFMRETAISITREKLREVAIEVLNCMYKSDSSLKFCCSNHYTFNGYYSKFKHTNRQNWLNRFVQVPVGKAFFAIEQEVDIDSFAALVRAAYDERKQYMPSTDEVVLRAQYALEQYQALLKDATEADGELRVCAAVVRQCKLLISYN